LRRKKGKKNVTEHSLAIDVDRPKKNVANLYHRPREKRERERMRSRRQRKRKAGNHACVHDTPTSPQR
jgi:hypothetical protein